jgi:ArsR family transcriptional regulator
MVVSTAVETDASVPSAQAQAALLSTVADPYRLAVLQTLTAGTTCVCELQERIPIAANLLSYHLKVLREAGLILGARRGRWIDYSLTEGALERLHAALPALPSSPADRSSGTGPARGAASGRTR